MNATLDPKTTALLLKIRKGATAAFDENTLAKKVFPAIGGTWSVAKFGSRKAFRADRETRWGFTIIAPNGEQETFHYGAHDYQTEKSYYNMFSWLKDRTGFMTFVLDALGMEAHEPAPERTMENSGTCPVCFRNVKLNVSGTIYNHGYTQEYGRGAHRGDNCYGVDFRPYEASNHGTVRYLGHLKTEYAGAVQRTAEAKRATGLKPWDLESKIKAAKEEEWALSAQIDLFAWLVESWVERPALQAGVPVPNYFKSYKTKS